MQLWTDYEGVTIDGAYALQKLLMPEGRSAFYSTAGRDGQPTVMRLIECHFDEEEILARWRCVAALNHPNFLRFEHFGQTELEGRTVVYAVLERVDANLEEVLDRGTLPVEDVEQLATSLVAALDVLHSSGFIHEHVVPRNIFALNDVVKLRSDCIREAPEGEEGRAAKQRDVRDLATVLLQALTQKNTLTGISDAAVPAPFNQIIRKGFDGTWGPGDIKAALESHSTLKKAALPAVASGPAGMPAAAAAKTSAPAAGPALQPDAQLALPLDTEAKARFGRASAAPSETWKEERNLLPRTNWLVVGGLIALLVLLFAWAHSHPAKSHPSKGEPAAAISQSAAPVAVQAPGLAKPQAADTELTRTGATTPAASSHAGWRVIAFTYNRRVDAEKKVAVIAQAHPGLAPSVFAPSGHAPYYVSIGGVMESNAAYALARRCRSLGLPRDTFARNYSR